MSASAPQPLRHFRSRIEARIASALCDALAKAASRSLHAERRLASFIRPPSDVSWKVRCIRSCSGAIITGLRRSGSGRKRWPSCSAGKPTRGHRSSAEVHRGAAGCAFPSCFDPSELRLRTGARLAACGGCWRDAGKAIRRGSTGARNETWMACPECTDDPSTEWIASQAITHACRTRARVNAATCSLPVRGGERRVVCGLIFKRRRREGQRIGQASDSRTTMTRKLWPARSNMPSRRIRAKQ